MGEATMAPVIPEPLTLEERAVAAGVSCRRAECSACEGKGYQLRPDPLDLRRLMDAHGVSLNAFVQWVKKERGTLSPGFVHMVLEDGEDKERSRRCPDWLLEWFLRIPERTWKRVERSGAKNLTKKRSKAQKERATQARRERLAERFIADRVLAKGQIWERVEPAQIRKDTDQVEVLKLFPKTVLVRSVIVKGGPERSFIRKNFLSLYRLVPVEVA